MIPHLNDQFDLQITHEVVRTGLSYGQTSAGEAIQRNIDKHVLAEAARDKTKIAQLESQKRQAEQALKQKYDEERDQRYALACKRLRRQRRGHRIVRWTLVVVGTGATATFAVLAAGVTGGAAAIPIGGALVSLSSLSTLGIFQWAARGSDRDQRRQEALDTEYYKDTIGKGSKTELSADFESSDEDDTTLDRKLDITTPGWKLDISV